MFSKNYFLSPNLAKPSFRLSQNISYFHVKSFSEIGNPYPPTVLQIIRKWRIQKTGKNLKYFVLLPRKICCTAFCPVFSNSHSKYSILILEPYTQVTHRALHKTLTQKYLSNNCVLYSPVRGQSSGN